MRTMKTALSITLGTIRLIGMGVFAFIAIVKEKPYTKGPMDV